MSDLFSGHEVLRGAIGDRSGQELLGHLKGWIGDGTVVFAQLEGAASGSSPALPILRGAALLSLHAGEVKARRMLGRFAGLATSGLQVIAWHHPAHEHPLLAPLGEGWPILAAAPTLLAAPSFPSASVQMTALHKQLGVAAWSGVLQVGPCAELWRDGRAVAAYAPNESGEEAMRSLRRAAAEADATLVLHPLDGRSASALHGLAEKQRATAQDANASGLHCVAGETQHHHRGAVEFVVPGGCGIAGSFVSADRLVTPPLRVAEEEAPSGASQRYTLTLRGRDALNPMTELWEGFMRRFGDRGRALLEALGRGDPLDVVAKGLQLDLREVQKLVASWVDEGYLRLK